jgi:ABC-2 type transport system permease protein
MSSVADAPSASGVVHRTRTLDTLVVLIRREFWEHRVLWMAPAVIAVLLVACAFPVRMDFLSMGSRDSVLASASNRLALFALTQWGLTLPQYLVMVIVLNFYLLDCLYAERKDRSILFWKSLPVSDAATVASKLLVGLVVVPLGVYFLSLITNLLFSAIWIARASFGQIPAAASLWDTVVWLKVEALMFLGLIVSILWYAPLAAYLVLVSAWARRSVFLWATLPPVFAILVERLALGTHFVAGLIEYRTWGIWYTTHLENAIRRTVTGGPGHIVSLTSLFDSLDIREFFANIDMWLGLLVAAAFAFAAARIRRYRDDT